MYERRFRNYRNRERQNQYVRIAKGFLPYIFEYVRTYVETRTNCVMLRTTFVLNNNNRVIKKPLCAPLPPQTLS